MTEHAKPKVTFHVNNREYHTEKKELTGSEIKVIAGVPADYELFEVKGDKTEPIGNEQVVHMHNGQHFRAIPAGTFGRHATTP